MNETTRHTIRKFNPGTFQSDDEVTAQFVVRKRELNVVLEVLRGNIDSPSCQHILVVAPRGRGKTMLLARVAAELRTEEEFSRHLLPVRFMEESQEIFNMADFWLEALFHLAREIAVQDPEFSRELHETHTSLTARWDEHSLAEQVCAVVLDAADYLNKKLVLMVENLQMLCRDVDDVFGWKIRKMLQTEPRIMLLSSATSRFKTLDDADEPFFELFRIVGLEPLNTEECRRLWQVVSGDTVTMREIRPLEILTGGSPRLLIIIGGLAQHRSLRSLMEDLVTLIDDHTEYFRSHLDVLGKTERRVYLAVIDLWQFSTPGEIAARARMDIRTVSTMLGRLVTRGAVIRAGSGRKRQYAATECLYCIYYKLRRERGEATVVRNLIRFMAAFYSRDELSEIFSTLGTEKSLSKTFLEGIERARTELPVIDNVLSGMGRQGVQKLSLDGTDISERVVERTNGSGSAEQFLQRISDAIDKEAFEKVIEIVDRVFASRSVDWSQVPEASIARAFHEKAHAQVSLGDVEGAIRAYDEVVERFGGSDAGDLMDSVAMALLNRGDLQGESGDLEEAIRAYDEVVERFGGSDATGLQVRVAMALVNRGQLQRELGDMEGALKDYDEVVERFGGSDATDLQVRVAMALFNRGELRRELGDLEGALRVCDEVVGRISTDDVTIIRDLVAKALLDSGHLRRVLGDLEGALRNYDEVIERFGASDTEDLEVRIAMALFNRGFLRWELGDLEGAIRDYDEVVERFGVSDTADNQGLVSVALLNNGNVRRELGDLEGAIRTFDEVVERFDGSDAIDLQVRVAMALLSRGYLRRELGDLESAIRTYDEVVERFDASVVADLHGLVAMALYNRGIVRGELGDWEGAITACDEVVERFGASDAADLQDLVATALLDRGHLRRELGDLERALKDYDEVVERFGTSDATDLQYKVNNALLFTGAIQTEIGHPAAALRTCKEIQRKIPSLPSEEQDSQAWREIQLRARALLVQGNLQEAMDAFHSAYSLFVPGAGTRMHQIVKLVLSLVRAGASVHELITVLSSDRTKAETLTPLVVALRQHAGETVRAPSEVLQVATDILGELSGASGP